jgi:hypothetical protein
MLARLNIGSTTWWRVPATFAATLHLLACGGGGGGHDDTELVQRAVDRGGVVKFAPRTYYLSRTIIIRRSNTVIQGAGPQTVFQYQASATAAWKHCANERVFTTPCETNDTPPRRITGAISIGDGSFSAADGVSDLQPGDWLIVKDLDSVIGNAVAVDWVQVDSISGRMVRVRTPFRTAFTNVRDWNPGRSGLGFQRVVSLVENTEFRDFNLSVPDAGPETAAVGISVFAALHTTIDRVVADSFNAQPVYSFLSKELTITNSEGRGHGVLSEFAATVDLTLSGNHFGEDDAAALGLDLGTAFFTVSNNDVDMSRNIGAYLLYGVHDGVFSNNRIASVSSAGNANGILAWGTQNISIADNYLAGGDGPRSTAMSVRSVAGEVTIPSVGTTLSGNTFGSGWALDYEPGTKPNN